MYQFVLMFIRTLIVEVTSKLSKFSTCDHIHISYSYFINLNLVGLHGIGFTADDGAVRHQWCNFSQTPPPIHLATADKQGKCFSNHGC